MVNIMQPSKNEPTLSKIDPGKESVFISHDKLPGLKWNQTAQLKPKAIATKVAISDSLSPMILAMMTGPNAAPNALHANKARLKIVAGK